MPATDLRLEVEGLSEALRGINRFNKELGAASRDVIREGAKVIQFDARRRLGAGGGRYPKRAGMIGRSASSRGAGIKLAGRKYPWSWGAEFGARRAWVYGRVTTQNAMRRRTFPVWRGNQFVVRGRGGPGWIIQPAIRANIERVTEQIATGLDRVLNEAMRQAGVPRGRE